MTPMSMDYEFADNSRDQMLETKTGPTALTPERPFGCGGCREYKGLELCAVCQKWYCVFCDGPLDGTSECDHLGNLIFHGDGYGDPD